MIKSVRIKFDKFLYNTGKAILVRIDGKEYWLANYMYKNLIVNKKLGGNCEIDVKFCDEKGIQYDESMATLIIEHHIPVKLDVNTIEHDETLIRSTGKK